MQTGRPAQSGQKSNVVDLTLRQFRLNHGFERPHDLSVVLRGAAVFDHEGRLLGVCDLVWGDLQAFKHNLELGHGIIVLSKPSFTRLTERGRIATQEIGGKVSLSTLLHLAEFLVFPNRIIRLYVSDESGTRIGCQRTVRADANGGECEVMSAGDAQYSFRSLLRSRI